MSPGQLTASPWPDVPSEDALAEVARRLVLNVRAAMDGRSIRAVAVDVGVGNVTLSNVLAGKAWPDLATIARLEQGLDVDLWPGRPVR
ncbi:helix-turn-helix transcriptional regulator [Curtobacterium sp. VKM Ac-2852]|nr:helix-turn-helix transcriptional regulator [Curtobacterium sp. VKM Ac-2852]